MVAQASNVTNGLLSFQELSDHTLHCSRDKQIQPHI
jgi:hypothetical protein